MHPICGVWFSHIPYKRCSHRDMAATLCHLCQICSRIRTQNFQEERRNQITGNTAEVDANSIASQCEPQVFELNLDDAHP